MSPAEQECRATRVLVGPTRRALASRRSLPRGGSSLERSEIKKKQAAAAKGGADSTEHALNAAGGGVAVRGLNAHCARMSCSTWRRCDRANAVASAVVCAQVRQMQSKPQYAVSLIDNILDQVCASLCGDEVDWSTPAERAAYWKEWKKLQSIIAAQKMPLPTLLIQLEWILARSALNSENGME